MSSTEIAAVVGSSHCVRWQWHRRDGVVPGRLGAEQFFGRGGIPVWSRMLMDKVAALAGESARFALLVPDFQFGNGIALDEAARAGPLLQDGFWGIDPAALTTEFDQYMLQRSMQALELWHERFGERVRYVFWNLLGRQVQDRIAGKYLVPGGYRHPLFNYDEIVAALPGRDIVDLSPLLRRPMHDVRRLFIDSSSHPSQIGYLLLNGLLFEGWDAVTAYERAVETVEADLCAWAQKLQQRCGRPVLLTGRSVWLDVLLQTLGATGQARLAAAGLVVAPVDKGPGQFGPAEMVAQHPLASCQPVVVSAGGADLSSLLARIFATGPHFWRTQPLVDWESATQKAIRERGETPRFARLSDTLPSMPNAMGLNLPASAVEQGPLGMPSWRGIVAVLHTLVETLPAASVTTTAANAAAASTSVPAAAAASPSSSSCPAVVDAAAEWRIEGDALVTRNNVAFLVGGNHAVLKFATGEFKPSAASLANFRDNIASRLAQAQRANCRYLHVIFPDKQSVLSEEFPFAPLHRLGDAYVAQLPDALRPHVLWPADQLKREKESPFLPLDTHLTDHGSLAVLRMMLEAVGIEAHDALQRIASRIVRPQRWKGDLGSKFNPPLFQEGLLLAPDWPQKKFTSPGGFNDGMVDIVLNPQAPVAQTVLLFGDSFFRMMLNHLGAVFSRVICLRTRFLHPEMVTLIGPDVIFTGNAERYLAHVSPDTDAQAFALYPHLRGAKELALEGEFLAAWAAVTAPASGQSKQFMADCGFSLPAGR